MFSISNRFTFAITIIFIWMSVAAFLPPSSHESYGCFGGNQEGLFPQFYHGNLAMVHFPVFWLGPKVRFRPQSYLMFPDYSWKKNYRWKRSVSGSTSATTTAAVYLLLFPVSSIRILALNMPVRAVLSKELLPWYLVAIVHSRSSRPIFFFFFFLPFVATTTALGSEATTETTPLIQLFWCLDFFVCRMSQNKQRRSRCNQLSSGDPMCTSFFCLCSHKMQSARS